MSFSHEAIAALPVGSKADKALLRALVTQRVAYCLDVTEDTQDFIATDPASGEIPLYLIQSGNLYQYDPDDTTTLHDGVSCLVTHDSLRYKYGESIVFLGVLTATDVGLGNVDNTSDAAKNAATATLTNKTLDGDDNTIENLKVAMFAPNVVDTDGSLAANSDTRLTTQKAAKTYMDSRLATADAMVFKGVIDCSANPNYPAADAGHTYKVSVAGKIGGSSGAVVEVGDMAICTVDSTASGNQATVGANWAVVQTNVDGAVTGPASSTSGNIATFNGTSGKIVQDSGKALPTGTIVGTSDAQTLDNKVLTGVTSGTAAAAGKVGEYISSSIASGSAITLANNTAADITSISLSAGDWEITGQVNIANNGATTTQVLGWCSTSSATLPTPPNGGCYFQISGLNAVAANFSNATGLLRLNITSTTTVYLSTYSSFTSGPSKAYGFIGARRVR